MVRSANEKSTRFYISLVVGVVVCGILIYQDLGVVAFVIIVFGLIFGFGLRDKFSNESVASAYAVFNKDGKSIAGGFTAGQLERQLRGGTGIVNDDDPVKGPIAEHLNASPSSINIKSRSVDRNLTDTERDKRRKAAAEAADRRLRNNEEHKKGM
jgi:hypothetical protein